VRENCPSFLLTVDKSYSTIRKSVPNYIKKLNENEDETCNHSNSESNRSESFPERFCLRLLAGARTRFRILAEIFEVVVVVAFIILARRTFTHLLEKINLFEICT
jgi:hypothetical protein